MSRRSIALHWNGSTDSRVRCDEGPSGGIRIERLPAGQSDVTELYPGQRAVAVYRFGHSRDSRDVRIVPQVK